MNEPSPLRIDIVSDVVCPWCIIGWKQLERAIGIAGVTAEVVWHPFELNPQMGPEGQNLREHVAEKYGSTPEQSDAARERLHAIGSELGISFVFSDESRIYNTFDAHRLIHLAAGAGKAHAAKLALFDTYFTRAQSVSDHKVLIDVARSIGLNASEVESVLTSDRLTQEVRQAEQFWTSNGIQGVPAIIFERRHLVSGAQGVANYLKILRQLTEDRDYAQAPVEPVG